MLVRALQGLSIFAIALIAFITLALAVMTFINHFTLPESLTNWLSVMVDMFVGASLVFIGWETHKVARYQAKQDNREEVRKNHIMLQDACKDYFQPTICTKDETERKEFFWNNFKNGYGTTKGAPALLYQLKAVKQHAELLNCIQIESYISQLIEEAKLVNEDFLKLYEDLPLEEIRKINKNEQAFRKKVKGSHSEPYKKYL